MTNYIPYKDVQEIISEHTKSPLCGISIPVLRMSRKLPLTMHAQQLPSIVPRSPQPNFYHTTPLNTTGQESVHYNTSNSIIHAPGSQALEAASFIDQTNTGDLGPVSSLDSVLSAPGSQAQSAAHVIDYPFGQEYSQQQVCGVLKIIKDGWARAKAEREQEKRKQQISERGEALGSNIREDQDPDDYESRESAHSTSSRFGGGRNTSRQRTTDGGGLGRDWRQENPTVYGCSIGALLALSNSRTGLWLGLYNKLSSVKAFYPLVDYVSQIYSANPITGVATSLCAIKLLMPALANAGIPVVSTTAAKVATVTSSKNLIGVARTLFKILPALV